MIKKSFLLLKASFWQGVALAALVAGVVLVPCAGAAIDETMPANIPQEIIDDWEAQGETAEEIKASLPAAYAEKCDGSFKSACHWRRVYRMKQFPFLEKIMFAKHHNIGYIAVGYWVNVGPSDVTDANFEAKGSLCLLKFDNYYSQYEEIYKRTDGCVKDPCISMDGEKVCFAVSGNGKGTGYRLFEMDINDPSSAKQLTFNPEGLTVADFEPCYLPNGDIMFSSTRCFGVIDCGWQPVSNMFVMDGEGKYIRRLGYDQVHTCYPVLRENGTVLYTRWEYNDRDVSNVMGLFQINPDGCHQTEVFGNQTTWPQTFIHGRPVPGNPSKFFAVASGHHGEYSGEVCVIDVSRGSNGPENVEMISPPRETASRDKDAMALGGVFRNSEYPYPLNDDWYLVSYREENQLPSFGSVSKNKYKIYLKNVDGTSRELIAWGDQSLHHPVVVAPWEDIWGSEPFDMPEVANFNDSMGTILMNDVYYGAGMEGVDKESGVAKSLRVIALNYRVMGACDQGVAGQVMGAQPSDVIFAAPTICPVSLYGASWESKEVIGEAKIFEDGSASFKVPARRPIYFQVIDDKGRCIATMRSWATLMPGETFACYGCHEGKAEAPPTPSSFLAGSPKELDKPMGIEGKAFDYGEFVQPILEDHCVSCHGSGHASGFDLRGDLIYDSGAKKSWTRSYSSLVSGIHKTRKNDAINITTIFSQPPQMPPYSFGSTKSGMIDNIINGHHDVNLTENEIKILACWIDLEAPHAGTYDSYMKDNDAQSYQRLEDKAQKWYDIEAQNVRDYAELQATAAKRGHCVKASKTTSFTQQLIGYLPTRRALVLKRSSQGSLMLMDLRGRVAFRMKLSDLRADGAETIISLPASLSRGLYLAKFEGRNGIQQAKISITQ